ncbi:MAG: Lrp/AsnC family transcriptional regulator [Planctomycetota bacterium]|jgi:Lrp/AsnC family transcriptional regulator for asnA, asnC and gidA
MHPDEIDRKIIELLREQHAPNNAIARKLGVSEGMVRQRLKRLKNAGILEVRAVINPDALTDQQLVLVAINVGESRLLEDKAMEISQLENVISVYITSGRYDLIAEVLLSSNKGLVQFLTEELSKIEGISKTESFLMLKNFHKFV